MDETPQALDKRPTEVRDMHDNKLQLGTIWTEGRDPNEMIERNVVVRELQSHLTDMGISLERQGEIIRRMFGKGDTVTTQELNVVIDKMADAIVDKDEDVTWLQETARLARESGNTTVADKLTAAARDIIDRKHPPVSQ
jgi:hypothetical protein